MESEVTKKQYNINVFNVSGIIYNRKLTKLHPIIPFFLINCVDTVKTVNMNQCILINFPLMMVLYSDNECDTAYPDAKTWHV